MFPEFHTFHLNWLPPAHPILIEFTGALIPAAIVSDWLGRSLRKPSLSATGWWLILYAALITPFSAYFGWDWMHDKLRMGETYTDEMAYHEWIGFALAGITVVLAVWRGLAQRRRQRASWVYLVLATLVMFVLVLQGHMGGYMTLGGDDPNSQPTSQSATTPSP